MPPELDLILLIVGCVVSGFIIGAAITYAVQKRKQRALAKALAIKEAAQALKEEPKPLPESAPTRLPLAQLWRAEQGRDLQVEMEGRHYAKASELGKENRIRMVELLREWVTWLGFSQPAAPPAAAPRPAVSASAAAGTPARVSASAPIPAAVSEKQVPASPKSMVEQVDDILREMQADLPANTPRIKLRDNMHHGVVVWIGLEHYDGIENVPDEQARQMVKRAVAEWERRAG
jgi:hypothetical protein